MIDSVIEDGIDVSPQTMQSVSAILVRTGDIIISRRGDAREAGADSGPRRPSAVWNFCLRFRFGTQERRSRSYASYYLGHPDVEHGSSPCARGDDA